MGHNAVIATIVEGKGEVESVPILLRRILAAEEAANIGTAKPLRVGRNRIVREGELERALRLLLKSRGPVGGIMILLDADRDCAKELAAGLLSRCENETQIPCKVVIAEKEFEAWFLGAKESLRGCRGIRADAVAPEHPESIKGAKERLSGNMEGRGRYMEVDDQPALAASMDLALAEKRCESFAKFLRDTRALVSVIRSTAK